MKLNLIRSVAVLAAMACLSMSQLTVKADLLWDNGPIITHLGGMTAPAGADRSAIAPGPPAGSTFGVGGNGGGTVRLADDFTVASAFTINSIQVFGYLTGATAPGATGVTMRIWSGLPGAGSVVWGDTTTNVLSTTGWMASPSNLGVFRTTTADTISTTRRVQEITASGLTINLAAGTYWLDFSYTGINFTPTVSNPLNMVLGNALQSLDSGATYPNLLDGTAPNQVQAAVPFIINGTAIPEPTALSLLVLGALVGVSRRRR